MTIKFQFDHKLNALCEDSIRRAEELENKGFLHVGTGVSGDEDAACCGLSLIPSESEKVWVHIKPISQEIAAKFDGHTYCGWDGPSDSGHFIKIVHNGIKYVDMQRIRESLSYDAINDTLHEKSKGTLDSVLMEITVYVFCFKQGDKYVDIIRDADERVRASSTLQGPKVKLCDGNRK